MPDLSPADTAAAKWATIAGQARTLAGRPSSTIKPAERAIGSTGRGALQAFAGTDPDLQATATGGLTLGALLGEGGMGLVHQATQTSLGREVAVKSVRPARQGPGPTLKLLQEAWIAGRLEHPNIIPVYDIATHTDGAPLIVLKRIEGEAWATVLSDPARLREYDGSVDPLAWHLSTLMQVCNAVAFAHDRKILHLDLKPDNVMLGRHGEVYVVDWGIAMALEDDGTGRLPLASSCNEIIGTPHYMAPEMLAAKGEQLSPRTDVYLLGSILYELLAGHPPHQGEALMEVLHAVLMKTPALPDDTPSELAQICRRAMAPDPEDRFASADDLRRALTLFLRHRDSMRLADEATERLAALRTALGEPRDDPHAHQIGFAPIRFGFEQALASWPDNTAARAGLAEAFELMIEFELNQGDPQVAAALLSEHPRAPDALRERVQASLGQLRADQLALAELGRQHDPKIGQRTRVFVFGVMGLLWTLLPAVKHLIGNRTLDDQRTYVLPAIVSLVCLGALSLWARDSLSRTRINRVAVSTCAVALLAHPIAYLGGSWMGLDGHTVLTLMALVWGALLGIVALAFDLRLFVSSAGYITAFLVASAVPELLFPALTTSNLLFMAVVLFLWRPEQWRDRPSPDEGE